MKPHIVQAAWRLNRPYTSSEAVDDAGRMLPGVLRTAIQQDRAAGFLPFLVVGTAGTVNTGAIDPLADIAEIASREKIWFHVDGAIGALAVLSDSLRALFKGVERSASVALDFHKGGQVPYDAGFLLVRNGTAHKRTFAQPAAYLQRADRGLAAGETGPCDRGPDLSRGFRALKTWMTIETLGTDRIGGSMTHTCMLARHLADCLQRHPAFELKAPVSVSAFSGQTPSLSATWCWILRNRAWPSLRGRPSTARRWCATRSSTIARQWPISRVLWMSSMSV